MDLMVKVLAVALVLIVLVVGLRYAFAGSPRQINSEQAVSNITNYLETSYPGASVSITDVNRSQYAGSWMVIASVVINGTRACPSYYVYSFDYPKFNLVYQVQNNYTANCVINGVTPDYTITSYPIAIARSYNLADPAVHSFVDRYGYANVSVNATYFNSTVLGGVNYSRVWLVEYSDAMANHTVDVGLWQDNGTLAYAANGTS